MNVELITKDDLKVFKEELLKEILSVVGKYKYKKWLKTNEVMELLGISDVTLQTFRNKGIIPFRKLGGVCYYNVEELDGVLQKLGKAKT